MTSALLATRTNDAPRPSAAWVSVLLLLAVVWGGSIPATKLALRDVPPLTLTALRYLVAAPLLAAILFVGPRPNAGAGAAAAALGVLGVGVGQLAQTLGVRGLSASAATVISALIPVFVVVLARIRCRQVVRLREVAGLGVAFAGVAVIAGTSAGSPGAAPGGTVRAEVLMLGSAVAIAVYYVLSMPLVASYSAVPIVALSSIAGGLALAPAALWELRHTTPHLTTDSVACVLYLALLVTAGGMLVWFEALQRLPASIAAVVQYLQPVAGVGASAALFGDPLGGAFAAGTCLVLAGIAITGTGRRSGKSQPPAGQFHAEIGGEHGS